MEILLTDLCRNPVGARRRRTTSMQISPGQREQGTHASGEHYLCEELPAERGIP
jgi:hypothetical protein